MGLKISQASAPALGTIRAAGEGVTIWISRDARNRPDLGRIADAIAHAVMKGAEVRWTH